MGQTLLTLITLQIMNILITGARAPIAVEMAKALKHEGHRIWMSDCLSRPLGKFSPHSNGYIRTPAPRTNFAGFEASLVAACIQHEIDYIIPTCEEVFWLAAVRNLPARTQLRASSLETLYLLHNKAIFSQMASDLGYGCTVNRLLRSKEEVKALADYVEMSHFVVKPVFSRSGRHTLLSPSWSQLKKLKPTPEQPWLAQTRETGTEYCVYNVAHEGKLLMHVAYSPKYRAGNGSSVYFEPLRLEPLAQLSQAFIEATNFTGQISFDVIETMNGLVAIECNPRGTSGMHIAAQHPDALSRALLGEGAFLGQGYQPVMLGLPLLMYNPGMLCTRQGLEDLWRAKDAMRNSGVGVWSQLKASNEILFKALANFKSFREVVTRDIEWNGEEITA